MSNCLHTWTPFFEKDHNRIDWLSIIKTKPRSQVQIVKGGNNDLIKGDDIFQIDKLIDQYRVALYIELENSNFHVTENTYVNINIDELNVILNTNEYWKVDDDEIDLEFKKIILVMMMRKMKRMILIKKYWIDLDLMLYCIVKLKLCKILGWLGDYNN
jgi:hypothetical protein